MAYYTIHRMNFFDEIDVAEEGFKDEMKNFLKDPWATICDWIDKIIMSLQRCIYSLKKKKVMMVPSEANKMGSQIITSLGAIAMVGETILASGNISEENMKGFKKSYLKIINGDKYETFMKMKKSTDSADVVRVEAKGWVDNLIDFSKRLQKLKSTTRRMRKGDPNVYQYARTCCSCYQAMISVIGKILSFEKDKTKVRKLDEDDGLEVLELNL